jgi:hypothetical protein
MAGIANMRRALRTFFHAIAQLLAGLVSLLVVATTVLALLLIGLDAALFDADTYKRALDDQALYERLPSLAAEQLGSLASFLADPCAGNPIACRLDGAPPELQSCLTEALGEKALVDVGTMERSPTEAELAVAQPCLDEYPNRPQENGGLASAPPEVRACIEDALGGEVFSTLLNAERPPTEGEAEAVTRCSEGAGPNPGGPGVGGPSMAFLNNLGPADWEKLIGTLLPPAEFQAMAEQALDQVFAFLKGETDSAKVSLAPIRERLAGPAGSEVIEILLAAQPECTDDQMAQLAAVVSQSAGNLVICRPPIGDSGQALSDINGQWGMLVDRMPDEAQIIRPGSPSASMEGGGPEGILSAARYLHRYVWLGLLVPLVLLLVVTLFGVRSRKTWLRWWGIPIFAAGLLTFAAGAAAMPGLDWAWVRFIAERIPAMFSGALAGVGRGLADSVVGQLSRTIMLAGGTAGLLGLVAIVASSFVGRRTPAPETGGD